MTGATFDKDLFDARLAQLAEVSRNARATWFTLILALLFAAIALADVRDVDFFRLGAGATLPLVGVAIPTYAFFIAAPLLLLALHAYFHLYLMKLWRALRAAEDARAADPSGRALDEYAWPWLIADAAIRVIPGSPRRALGFMTQAVSVALGWLAAPAVLLLFWVRSWAPHDELLSLFVLTCALAAVAVFGVSLSLGRAVLRGEDVDRRGWTGVTPLWAQVLFYIVSAALAVVSWERTEGGLTRCRDVSVQAGWCGEDQLGDVLIPLYPAQLYRAEIVARPADWRPRAEARRAFLADWSGETEREIEALLAAPEPPDWLEAADAAFAAERSAQIARLEKPDLAAGRPLFGAFLPAPAVDLREADLRGAAMTGLDLSGARLAGARLDEADLEGGVLRRAALGSNACRERPDEPDRRSGACTSLRRASLSNADLRGADLSRADLAAADLGGAELNFARLAGARLDNARLDSADFEGADLASARAVYASMRATSFDRADLQGANLAGGDKTKARFVSADLRGARIGGVLDGASFARADLGDAFVSGKGEKTSFFWSRLVATQFAGADLTDGIFEGALLQEARFIDTRLRGGEFSDALLVGADLSRLDPASTFALSRAAADAGTVLPARFPAPSCFEPPAHLQSRSASGRTQYYRYAAEHLGIDVEEFVDVWVCGGPSVLKEPTSPDNRPTD